MTRFFSLQGKAVTLQKSHYSTCTVPFPSLRRRGEARALDFRSPPRWITIGGLVAGVTKAPPPSLWDHSGAVSGMGRGPEERARCVLGFVVHPPSCSRRAGPLHAENYNPQQPRREPREGGARVTWVLGLGGLFLSAAVAAGGPGPFVWSGCGGAGGGEAGAARPAASPARWVRPPLEGGGGPPPRPGLTSGAAAPP